MVSSRFVFVFVLRCPTAILWGCTICEILKDVSLDIGFNLIFISYLFQNWKKLIN